MTPGPTRQPTPLELETYANSAAACRRTVACWAESSRKAAEWRWWTDVWRERQAAYRRAETAESMGWLPTNER